MTSLLMRDFFKNDEVLHILQNTKRVWREEEVVYYILNNDKSLYGALRKLYDCQTDKEKESGNTQEHNGIGFNAYDAPYLSAMVKSLNEWGKLTNGQKEKTRQILVKYRKQLTNLANS